MRRVVLLAVSILIVVSMAASPALAHDRNNDCWDEDVFFVIFCLPNTVTFVSDSRHTVPLS